MIALLGHSPPVVTEAVQYLSNLEGRAFRDVVVLSTSDDFVRAGVKLIEASLQVNYPRVRLHDIMMENEDVLTDEDNLSMMERLAEAIRRERDDYGARKIYLNVSGGRKIASISASLFGSLLGVTNILHIVNRDVHTFNENLERARSEIEEFLNRDDIVEYYQSRKGLFDRILYPPPETLYFLNIPVIPYPPDSLERLVRMLRGLYFEEEFVPDFVLERYKEAGLIVYDRIRTYPTELGERILRILR